ncbi:hypothetical protein F5D26_31280 [Burkholderia pseudomallei]|nr:hypothetical protein F5D26_31280 [Burkholderia pseudomallei]
MRAHRVRRGSRRAGAFGSAWRPAAPATGSAWPLGNRPSGDDPDNDAPVATYPDAAAGTRTRRQPEKQAGGTAQPTCIAPHRRKLAISRRPRTDAYRTRPASRKQLLAAHNSPQCLTSMTLDVSP